MDVGTGLALLGSARLVEKILGPTAEYVGEGLKYWTERGAKNVGRIFDVAARKLGSRLEEEAVVPPKVLKGIVTEGAFCDDALVAEYLGGVLASSRSGTSRDDRGVVFISLIGRLSSYQIRSHYAMYHVVRRLHGGQPLSAAKSNEASQMRSFIPMATYATAMAFDDHEAERLDTLIGHTLWGLHKEDLIGHAFASGALEAVAMHYPKVQGPGVVFEPTAVGVELFLWAYGRADIGVQNFLDPEQNFSLDRGVVLRDDCQPAK